MVASLPRGVLLAALLFPLPGCNSCDDDDDDAFPPASPTGLTAAAVTTERIDLAWTDASLDEAGFRIERSPDGAAWTEIAVVGANVTSYIDRGLAPNTLYYYRVRAYNAVGTSAYAGPATATTFPLAWTQHLAAGPLARSDHSAIYDAANQRMILFGGLDLDPTADGSILSNEVWELSLPTAGTPAWNPLAPTTPPTPRFGHSAIYDPVNQRMVVFGGQDDTSILDEVWILTLGPSPAWSQITPAGPPPARFNHTAVYDPGGQRMIVFGGSDGISLPLSDVWALSLSGAPGWSLLTPAAGPAGRQDHSAIHDLAGQRMIIFGGDDGGVGGDAFANDSWALSLGASPAWSLLTPAGPPSRRSAHTAIYDAANLRMVLFSGNLETPPLLPDLHALGTVWSALAPTGAPPAARFGHSAIYDGTNRRMVVFGGDDGTGTLLADLWTLGL